MHTKNIFPTLMKITTSGALSAVLLLAGATAFAQQDSGSAAEYPWSGFWWAHAEGGLTGPLAKYDQVYGTRCEAWEAQNHVNREGVQPWFGHCHAWSAAAVTEKEPREARTYKNVEFSVGDQKGLLTALHAQDEANSYGDRYGDGRGSENHADLTPDEVWRHLQNYVKQQKIPLIFDLEAGDEVWNYPVFQYEVSYQDAGNGMVNGTMILTAADDDVYPDYLGTQPAIFSYTFTCRMQGGSVVAGSGRWTGESVNDHPDFAWYPYVARAENPGMESSKVSAIVGAPAGGSDNPPADDDTPPNLPAPPSDDQPLPDYPPPPPGVDVVPPAAPPVDYAQILTPIEMVSLISNKTSHFGLDIFVDQNDGGRYPAGAPIRVSAESDREGYLYIFDIGPKGDIQLVFPRPGEPHFIPANTLVDLPGRGEEPWFRAETPGEHHLRGVVTTTPLTLTGFHTTKSKKKKGKYPRNVQKMHIPPSVHKRVSKHLNGFYSKNVEMKPPEKIKAFAQDDCLFFVLNVGN